MVGAEERLVALDVDVNVGGMELGDGVEAIGAAGEIGGREFEGDVESSAEVGNFFGVCGDEDLVELRAGAGGVYDPGEERSAGDFPQDFARQAGRREAGRDDTEDAERIRH